jgi:hypothetical protein
MKEAKSGFFQNRKPVLYLCAQRNVQFNNMDTLQNVLKYFLLNSSDDLFETCETSETSTAHIMNTSQVEKTQEKKTSCFNKRKRHT